MGPKRSETGPPGLSRQECSRHTQGTARSRLLSRRGWSRPSGFAIRVAQSTRPNGHNLGTPISNALHGKSFRWTKGLVVPWVCTGEGRGEAKGRLERGDPPVYQNRISYTTRLVTVPMAAPANTSVVKCFAAAMRATPTNTAGTKIHHRLSPVSCLELRKYDVAMENAAEVCPDGNER